MPLKHAALILRRALQQLQINNIMLAPPLALLALTLAACQGKEMQQHKSGLKYRYIERNKEASRPETGEVLKLEVLISGPQGNELYDTREIPGPFLMRLKEPSHKGGSIENAYSLMHEGDSLHCLIKADSFYRHSRKTRLPKTIQPADELEFRIKLHRIYSGDEFARLQEERKQERQMEEESYLQKYIMRHEIKEEPRPSGLYFLRQVSGNGPTPQPGDSVKVHYKGALLGGQQFDSSYERKSPLALKIGGSDVIPGLEEGISMMHQGGKARLIIPSHLAYGDEGYGEIIPPYSTLIFDVELIKVY